MLSKTLMSDKAAQRWKETRAKGRWRYMLLHGILLWGLPVGIAVALFISCGRGTIKLGFAQLATTVVVYCIVGMLFSGWWQWRANEKSYQWYLQQKKSE